MAQIALIPDPLLAERRQAGEDYLVSLRRHGVEPEGLTWALGADGEFELLMVTSLVDRVGPKAIYDTLFSAYDKAVTPKSIDPWIVTVFSPRSEFGLAYLKLLDFKVEFRNEHGDVINDATSTHVEFGQFTIRMDWIYVKGKVPPSVSQLRGWHRFRQQIDKIAA